jgi:DNA-binding CsgD family transcriptional regulator
VRRLSGSAPLDQKNWPALNSHEMDVLRLVVQGSSNKEIASRMNISESAFKNTLQQLFGKTEVRTRSHLVRVALERYRDLLWWKESKKTPQGTCVTPSGRYANWHICRPQMGMYLSNGSRSG